ncbi:hypothetical protein Tco_0801630 [Tanacetum coccineum]|uniref:Uncharacterized protein n=1 Tax=Tanacetum coccineum TaxID=301880 RepID=A0ABQ5A0P9_9ASTR
MMTKIYQAFKVPPTQAITSITPHPESSHAAPRIDKRKGIATELDEDPSKKLVPASSIVRPDPDEPDKEEQIKKAEKQVRLFELTRPEVIKVVQEEAEKIGLDPKKITSAKAELNKKRAEQYMWTMTNRIKPETITDVKIHPNSKPAVLSVYRNNDKRNYDVHDPFKPDDFLRKRYERLNKIPKELGIPSTHPASVIKQASSQTSGRKRKRMELEPETKVPGLECNRSLPEGVLFVNNMVIEEPEYGIFFTDVFGDQAFQRWNDIHKVGVDALVSYLVMASMVKTKENARFSLKLRKLIADHPAQEKLKSKQVKLEALGYKLD